MYVKLQLGDLSFDLFFSPTSHKNFVLVDDCHTNSAQ